MKAPSSGGFAAFCRSIVFKNILLFLLILIVAVLPLSLSYYRDSRDLEIQNLASKLEFFAERGASWLDVEAIHSFRSPADMQLPEYRELIQKLNRIQTDFNVNNAIVMRRMNNGQYSYVAGGDRENSSAASAANPCSPSAAVNPCSPRAAANPCSPAAAGNPCAPGASGGSIFDIGNLISIHKDFPATYRSTEDTWQAGQMMHSQLFGGRVGGIEYDQFLQINTPLKLSGRVVAILMLNKFAKPVADAVQERTIRLVSLTVAILIAGLILFGLISSRMLRLLKDLTNAADKVSQGNLDVTLPEPKSQDEVGRLVFSFNHMIEGLRQRDFIRDTFGRYISEEVVDELLTSPDGLKLGGELREITLLVSDLRGFTSMSSRMAPHEVIEVINGYLEHMIDIIARFGGTVDEFQGDGILAFFGAPIEVEDGPERAVACAIEMQKAMEAVNAGQRRRGLPELLMGIGVNTGEVIVGNIGSEKRTKYGAIGTTINTAYRIESNTVGAQILISPSTYGYVKDIVEIGGTFDAQFKGLEEPVKVYDVSGIGGKYACEMPEKAPENFIDLDPAISADFFPLDGKTVSDSAIPGLILRLSESSAEAALDEPVDVLSSLKIRIASPEGLALPEAYAKVMKVDPPEGSLSSSRVILTFTSLPEDTKAFLEQKRGVSPQP
jgi:class 3 adenylate cyclase